MTLPMMREVIIAIPTWDHKTVALRLIVEHDQLGTAIRLDSNNANLVGDGPGRYYLEPQK